MASKYSSIDNSPSKQKYSFSKAERFPKIGIYGAMSFYNLPSMKNGRSTSFGYGSRYNFVPKNSETTPSCYNISYGVQSKQPYAPKYSFGLGRENIVKTLDKSIPGPGKYYSPLKSIGRDSPKYSMKGKYKNSFYPISESPGPAAYDPQTKMNARGVFGIAGFKNVKSYDFSKGEANRFNYKVENTPGPQYTINKSLIGNIYESRFKSTHGIHMGSRYETKDRDNYPGPGAYERYGDFYKYNDRYLNTSTYNRSNSNNNSTIKTPEKDKKDVNKSYTKDKEEEDKSHQKDKKELNKSYTKNKKEENKSYQKDEKEEDKSHQKDKTDDGKKEESEAEFLYDKLKY